MTTSSLRLMAVGIAFVFAVLTGLLTGMVGEQVCTTAERPSGQTPTPGQNQQEGEVPGTGRSAPSGQHSTEPGQAGQPPVQGQDPTEGDQTGEPTPGGGGLPGNPGGTGGTITVQDARRVPLAVPTQQECTGGGFSVPAAMVGFFGALLAAGAVAALLFGRRSDPGVAVPAATDNGGRPHDQLEGERSTLIQTCIYVRDRATSKALADRLGWALQEVGVATLAPNGAAFDPAYHEAGGAATTSDPAKAGTIAAVEVPGYVDRGVVLRAPVVTVYRQDGQ